MFWNCVYEYNPKLSLGFQFDQAFMKKTRNKSCCKIQKIAKLAAPFAMQQKKYGCGLVASALWFRVA